MLTPIMKSWVSIPIWGIIPALLDTLHVQIHLKCFKPHQLAPQCDFPAFLVGCLAFDIKRWGQ